MVRKILDCLSALRPLARRLIIFSLIAMLLATTAGCGRSGGATALEPGAMVTPEPVDTPAIPTLEPSPTTTIEPITPTPVVMINEEPTPTVHDSFMDSTPTPDIGDSDDAGDDHEPEDERVIDIGAFHQRVSDIVGDIDGELEIVVSLPDGTILYERDSAEPMEAASLY